MCYKSQAAGPRRGFNLRPQFSASGGASNSATPIPLQLVPESHLSSPPTLRCAIYMIWRAAARKLEGPSAVIGPRGRLPSSLPACMVQPLQRVTVTAPSPFPHALIHPKGMSRCSFTKSSSTCTWLPNSKPRHAAALITGRLDSEKFFSWPPHPTQSLQLPEILHS